ncbi:hypothetical protein Pla52o_27450 [Novipirellula galeiformis]|uniref:Uncharacterized protein n=1 Tax=Novipirellula galeiformis TaxID=2528004 RepID=A0A5C6CK66_9BACT|nr:hypothetical protein [Novipirellula galeiformis]TWU23209.1 hypothetical protein Pla52o_27450 [Novipirellula galeiformis]
MRLFTSFAIAATFTMTFAIADEPGNGDAPVVMPVEMFFKEMQLLARRVPVGKTKLEQEDSLATLREQIHAKFDDVVLEYRVRIKGVTWKDGLATIQTSSPIHKHKPSARFPFHISPTQPLAIPMSREDATELQTRKPLTFRGKLSFQDGKWGIVGRPPKSQSVFYVKSEDYKQIVSIGTFVTEDYAILIGDEEIFSLHLEAEAK